MGVASRAAMPRAGGPSMRSSAAYPEAFTEFVMAKHYVACSICLGSWLKQQTSMSDHFHPKKQQEFFLVRFNQLYYAVHY